jgi:hypothetical protein
MLTLIRGFDPLENTLEFGRELILSIRDGFAAEIESLPPCTLFDTLSRNSATNPSGAMMPSSFPGKPLLLMSAIESSY